MFGLGEFNITNCRDNYINFFVEHPNIVNIIGDIPNTSFSDEILELKDLTYARPQDMLFDFPMFYVGK